MKTYAIRNTQLNASRIACGCMTLPGKWAGGQFHELSAADSTKALRAAVDAGVNFFDHANIYGGGKAEFVFGQLIAGIAPRREQIIIQTKCGIRFAGDPEKWMTSRYDFSARHILVSVEGSLKRLRTDYIDILLLHRPDVLVEPEEVARAFDALQSSGKVRYFGVSNHSGAQIELLRTCVKQPLVANQLQLSLVHSHLFDAGIVANQSKHSFGCEGTLEYCRIHGITIQAWGPLAHGAAAGEGRPELAKAVNELAAAKNVSKEAIAIAWLLRHPAGIQPVIGTTNPERIAGACQGDSIELTREEWYALFVAGRGASVP